MRKSMIYALLSMIVLAVILAIIMFICWSPSSIISFLGVLISGGLLIINLIAIVSFVFIAFVFKIDSVPQAIKYALIAVAGVLVVVFFVITLNPLRRSQEHIRERMLTLTPIGTSMEDVVKTIEGKEKWKVWNISSDGNWKPLTQDSESYMDILIERKSIEVLLGEYRTIFITSVRVYWEFDEDLKLIDITVKKDTDSL